MKEVRESHVYKHNSAQPHFEEEYVLRKSLDWLEKQGLQAQLCLAFLNLSLKELCEALPFVDTTLKNVHSISEVVHKFCVILENLITFELKGQKDKVALSAVPSIDHFLGLTDDMKTSAKCLSGVHSLTLIQSAA